MELFPLMNEIHFVLSYCLSSSLVSQFGLLTFVEVQRMDLLCISLEMGFCVNLLVTIFALLFLIQRLALFMLFSVICAPLV